MVSGCIEWSNWVCCALAVLMIDPLCEGCHRGDCGECIIRWLSSCVVIED